MERRPRARATSLAGVALSPGRPTELRALRRSSPYGGLADGWS
jgi:hypothetical protein